MSGRRPARTTFQPASSSACAVARPMPLPAPVMTAIFALVAIGDLLIWFAGVRSISGNYTKRPLLLTHHARRDHPLPSLPHQRGGSPCPPPIDGGGKGGGDRATMTGRRSFQRRAGIRPC